MASRAFPPVAARAARFGGNRATEGECLLGEQGYFGTRDESAYPGGPAHRSAVAAKILNPMALLAMPKTYCAA